MSAAEPSTGRPAADVPNPSEAAESSPHEQLCPICRGSLKGQGSLLRQPLCGHELHEKCWHKWVLTSTADPLRCLSCLWPLDQKNMWRLMKVAVELFMEEAFEECQERVQQLLVLAESPLLLEEPERGSGEASLHTQATRVVLLAYYLRGLVREVQAPAPPVSFACKMGVAGLRWLQRCREPTRSLFLAALVWEAEPEKAAELPVVSRILNLQDGEDGARNALDDLRSDPGSPFFHISKAMTQIRQALERGDACGRLELSLTAWRRSLFEIFAAKDVQLCQGHLQPLVVLGESQVLLKEPERDSPVASLHAQATQMVLLSYYLSGLLIRAKASTGSFDWKMAEERLSWLQDNPKCTRLLAALAWEMEPDQAARLPIVARLLKLQEGRVEAHSDLAALYAGALGEDKFQHNGDEAHHSLRSWYAKRPYGEDSKTPFWDFSKAVTNIRRALELGDAGACLQLLLPNLLYGICEIFKTRDSELCQEPLQQLLVLGESQLLLADSQLLLDDPTYQSPEALLQLTATRTVLFAHYMLGMLKQGQGPLCWSRLSWLLLHANEQRQTHFLAVLMLEMEPDQAAKLPIVARVLKLQEGRVEAHSNLAALYASGYSEGCWLRGSPFRDVGKACVMIRRAWELGDAGACFRRVFRSLTGETHELFLHCKWVECRSLFQELLTLGESMLLAEVPKEGSPEALLQVTATRAVLFAQYVWRHIEEVRASPDAGDHVRRFYHLQHLQGFGEEEQTRVLAALLWRRMPDQVAKLPVAAKVLELDQGNGRTMACHILGKYYRGDINFPLSKSQQASPPLESSLSSNQPVTQSPEAPLVAVEAEGLLMPPPRQEAVSVEPEPEGHEVQHHPAAGEQLPTSIQVPSSGDEGQLMCPPMQELRGPRCLWTLWMSQIWIFRMLLPSLSRCTSIRWRPLAAASQAAHTALRCWAHAVHCFCTRQSQHPSMSSLPAAEPDALQLAAATEGPLSVPSQHVQLPIEPHPEGKHDAASVPLQAQLPLEPKPEGPDAQLHECAAEQLSISRSEGVLIHPPLLPVASQPADKVAQHHPTATQQAQGLLPALHRSHLPLPLPQDITDDQDLDFKIALAKSVQEHMDPLQAVRSNPLLMQRQADLHPHVEEQMVQEELFLLQFQRGSPEFVQRLQYGDLLQPCREELKAAGYPWLLEARGVTVFVDPCQYALALQLLQQHAPDRLLTSHVVTTRSFLPVVLLALEGCPAGAGKLQSLEKLGEVRMPAESEEPETQTIQSNSQGGQGRQSPIPGEEAAPNPPGVSQNSQAFMPHSKPTPREVVAPQPVFEDLFLLHFQRNSKDFKTRLHSDARLQPCRQALEAAGCRWLLEDKEVDVGLGRFSVKVFVHPTQYHLALRLLHRHKTEDNIRLYPNHVVVSETFFQLVMDTVEGCPGGGGTLKQREGQGRVKIGEVPVYVRLKARLEELGMETQGTGLNVMRRFCRHPANKSEGSGSVIRRRKPDFKAFSLSSSSQVSVHDADHHSGARNDSLTGNPMSSVHRDLAHSQAMSADNHSQSEPDSAWNQPGSSQEAAWPSTCQGNVHNPVIPASVGHGSQEVINQFQREETKATTSRRIEMDGMLSHLNRALSSTGQDHRNQVNLHGTGHGPQLGLLAAPPGLAPVPELLQALGLSKQRTFFDGSPRRRRRPVTSSTRTAKSNPRCRALGSEVDENDLISEVADIDM